MPRDAWRQTDLKSCYGGDAYERQQEEEGRERQAQADLISQLQARREQAKRKKLKARRQRGHTR